MEIRKLYLGHFGKFHDQEIELKPGINIIYGTNEAGKSTIHSFIRGMFFGIEKKRGRESREELYSRYQPWESPGAYQGGMLMEKEGREYQISRNFLQKSRSFSIVDRTTGRELSERELANQEFFHHFNELVYRNTISIEQLKAGTEREFAATLQNFIANLSTTRNNEVDISNALQILKEKKKELESRTYSEDEAEEERLLADLSEKVERYDNLSVELSQLMKQRETAKAEYEKQSRSFFCDRTAELSRVQEKYRIYGIIEQELSANRELLDRLDCQMQQLEDGTDSDILDADLKQLNRLREEQQSFEKRRHIEFDQEEDRLAETFRKKSFQCMIMLLLGLVCTVTMVIAASTPGISIGISVILVSLLLYLILTAKRERKSKEIQNRKQNTITEQLELTDRRKEILIRNYVQDIDALRKKYNTRIVQEAELRQLKERKKERQQEMGKKLERQQRIAQELHDYAAFFHYDGFSEMGIGEDTMQQLTAVVENIRDTELNIITEYKQQKSELLVQEEHIRWEMSMIAGASVQMEDISKKKEEDHRLAAANQKEIEALELAMSEIKALSAEIHDSFGEQLNQSISEKVNAVTNGAYTEVVMDEQLNVKVLSKSGYLTLDKLSAGTNCQIYLAVRLAMADVFFPEEIMPLLFDDTFALYDDERTRAALSYLAGLKRQVIIFTCHSREHRLLKELNICHSYLELEQLA